MADLGFEDGQAARTLCGVVGAEWRGSDPHVVNTESLMRASPPQLVLRGDEYDIFVVVVIAASRRETPVSAAQVPVSQEDRTVRILTALCVRRVSSDPTESIEGVMDPPPLHAGARGERTRPTLRHDVKV
jgi:hypothetical protein